MQATPINPARAWHGRHGLTIVEVLVAVAIVGLLMAILIPAAQAVREASRRTHCASNLRQIMLAQHQYLDLYQVFPGLEGIFHSQIVSFLEMSRGDASARAAPYACPSDPLAKGELGQVLFSSYFGNTGLRRHGYRGYGDGFAGGLELIGPDTIEHYVSDRDVTDGLSATAAVAERLALPGIFKYDVDWNEYPQHWRRLLKVTFTRYGDDQLPAMADDCQLRPGLPRATQILLINYNHIVPPNHSTCTNGAPFDQYLNFPVAASSLHPQGVNVAMADGSVRFVTDVISRDIWWALGTRSGGESVATGDPP